MAKKLLLVIDAQYDFIFGSLAVNGADKMMEDLASYIKDSGKGYESIIATADWHPITHCSFKENGGIWPVHCVAGQRGGEIHEKLRPYASEELTFDKGCDRNCEQYSGFEGRNSAGQSLSEVLELLDVAEVIVCGIATEYCVRNTCEDLLKAGFKVLLKVDALAYVDAEGHRQALAQMQDEGIELI